MGGKAFASGSEPLLTPRMPLEIYTLVQQRVRSLLCKHFQYIDTPLEAPAKSSYGDVDILVANATSDLPEPKIASLAKILGAKKWISSNSLMNFALPYPVIPTNGNTDDDYVRSPDEKERGVEIGEPLDSNTQPSKKTKLPDDEEKFVQVDIHICKTYSNFLWELFHQAHGDLWNILGSMIRSRGITINDTGLYLRISELETVNRKKSLVFLSSDPDQVLEFLGLERAKWCKIFQSIQEMFEYATTCRFFYVRIDDSAEEGKDVQENGTKEDKSLFKSNDRKRLNQRPVFKQWIEEYIPELRRKGLFLVEPMPREKVTEIALETFGDGPKAEYRSRLAAWEREKERDEVLGAIKAAVPILEDGMECKGTREWQYRSGTIRALKAILLDGSTDEGVVLEDGIIDGDGFYDFDKVRDFVERNRKEVGDIKWATLQKAAAESMKKKAKGKAMKEGHS